MLGRDARWHYLEECDDGNLDRGDGCSEQCTVEQGYGPDCTPLEGGSALPFLYSLAAGQSLEGYLVTNPLGQTECRFGWGDAMLVPAMPSPGVVQPVLAVYRGIYRRGPAIINDATVADPAAALGDAFICPCAAAADAALPNGDAVLVEDTGGGGGAPSGASGVSVLLRAASGSITEPEGAYIHDGIRCTWLAPYGGYSAARLDLVASAAPARGLEKLEISQLGISGSGECFSAPCVIPILPFLANDAANVTVATGPGSLAVGLPARITFAANSARALGPSQLSGPGGRFVLAYGQGPSDWLLEQTPSQEAEAVVRTSTVMTTPAAVSVRWPGQQRSQKTIRAGKVSAAADSRNKSNVDDGLVHQRSPLDAAAAKVNGRYVQEVIPAQDHGVVGRLVDSNLVRSSSPVRRRLLETSATSLSFALSLAAATGQPAPCRFEPIPGQALLRLGPSTGAPSALEGMWTGSTVAQVAPNGGPLFALYSAGRCLPLYAISQFSVASGSNGDERGGSGSNMCATQCVGTPQCVFYSYSPAPIRSGVRASGDCLLFAFCQMESSDTSNNQTYATFRLQTGLVNAPCSADLAIRGRVVRLHVHSCANSVSDSSSGVRHSPQTGALLGVLVPDSSSECDLMSGSGPCNAAILTMGDQPLLQPYWTSNIKWTSSARDRVVGDIDNLLLALDAPSAAAAAAVWPLSLAMSPASAGQINPQLALDPRSTLSAAQLLRMQVVNRSLSLPAPRDDGQISSLAAASACRGALEDIMTVATADHECVALTSALLPSLNTTCSGGRGNGTDSMVTFRSAMVAGLCSSPCASQLKTVVEGASSTCAAAWRGVSFDPVLAPADTDGLPILLLSSPAASIILETFKDLITVPST